MQAAAHSSVTIVIPTRDRAGFVGQAVSSARRAHPPPERVIVVDGGSTDGTGDVLRSFGDSIDVLQGRFPNAAAARNAGARAATTEFLGFLDSDDHMLDGKCGPLADALRARDELALVHGRTEVIDRDGRLDRRATAEHRALFARAERLGTGYDALAAFCAMYTSATLVRRVAFEDVGGYDEGLDAYEDWDLYLRLSLRWRLAYDPCPAARYRVWEGNVPWDHTAAAIIRVAQKHLSALPDAPPSLRSGAAFGFHARMAASNHTLVQSRETRRAALAALRMRPLTGLVSADVRRPLVRSLLPDRILRRRRPRRGRR